MAWTQATTRLVALFAVFVGPSKAFVTGPVSNIRATPPSHPSSLSLNRRDVLHTSGGIGISSSSGRGSSSSRRPGTAIGAGARQVTGEELEKEMTEWEQPMILDVFASWCGPCIQLKAEVEKLSEALQGKCRVLKLDSDEEEDMAGTLNIYGLPTLIFMKDGKVKHRTEGFKPAGEILQLADIHLFGKAPPEVTDPADDLFIGDEDASADASTPAAVCPPGDPNCVPPASS